MVQCGAWYGKQRLLQALNGYGAASGILVLKSVAIIVRRGRLWVRLQGPCDRVFLHVIGYLKPVLN